MLPAPHSKWVVNQAALNDWVAEQGGGRAWPESYTALGLSVEGKIVAAAVIYDANGTSAGLSGAIADPSVSRKFARLVFKYAFGQLGLHRLTMAIRADNMRSIRLAMGLGAIHEATLREAGAGRVDVHIYALFRDSSDKWRKLSGNRHWRDGEGR